MTDRVAQLRAYSVHLLTATGAVFAMLALLAAVAQDWVAMWLWLVAAFVVDGIDGPLARHFGVRIHAPQVDGALLDLIIDYLTYVFIPAYALFASGLLPGWTAWAALFVIVFASAIYFADTRMKTEDASFLGFPGCWNMVVLVVFALAPPPALILLAIALLAPAMFLPLRFVHPVRTRRWRAMTLPVALVWTLCAGLAAASGFAGTGWISWGLGLATAYLLTAGALQQALPERARPGSVSRAGRSG